MLSILLKLNILHLIVACTAGATIVVVLRESRGRSLPPGQLFAAVPFALATAMLLIAMEATETREPQLWVAGLVVGMALGVARGSFLSMQLDRMYSRLRHTACAGYLAGRAATLWRRSLSAPHQTLHHTSP